MSEMTIGLLSSVVWYSELPVQLIHLRVTLTLAKFPSNSHDMLIALKDGELILHLKAPVKN